MAHGTDENLRARRQIQEALFSLMGEKRFSEISVSDIVRASGVARSTFYRNYSNREAVIEDFIQTVHAGMTPQGQTDDELASRILRDPRLLTRQLERAFSYVLQYKDRFVILEEQGFGTLLQRLVDGYAESLLGTMPASSPSRYLLYLASGAMCNTISAWLREGAVEPPRVMAGVCAKALSKGVVGVLAEQKAGCPPA